MTDLVELFEKRILTTIRLTQHQMQVLAMILASPEGNLPDEDISKGPNLKQARDLLIQLDMITNDGENKYSVTEKGQNVAKDENIVDDMGELSELGQGLAYPDEDKKEPAPSSPGPGGPSDFPAPDAFAQVSTEIAEPPAFGAESVERKETLLQEMMGPSMGNTTIGNNPKRRLLAWRLQMRRALVRDWENGYDSWDAFVGAQHDYPSNQVARLWKLVPSDEEDQYNMAFDRVMSILKNQLEREAR